MSNLIADPSNLNIYLKSKKVENETNLVDPWYNTKYSKAPFSDELMSRMKNPNLS